MFDLLAKQISIVKRKEKGERERERMVVVMVGKE
jgi:hypothetical protein